MQEREDAWRDRVQRWGQSGLNLKTFASQEGVHPSTLAWWRDRIAQRDAERSASPSVALTRVTIRPESVVAAQLEIVSGGSVVRIPTGFCAETLARVLSVLEGRR
jgi:hypothetical protein